MAVSAKVYSKFHLSALLSTINYTADTIKISLHTSTYTPVQATDQFHLAATNEIANGNGYTTGGATLASKTAATATTVATFDAADVSWAASTITARYAVVYDATPGTEATRPLICYIDFGADVISSGGTFTITFDPLGIFTMTVA